MIEFNHRPVHDIETIAQHYTEKDGVPVHYVCTTALGDAAIAFDIFYRDTPHPEFGNRYFGLYYDHIRDCMMIINAEDVEDYKFTCSLASNDQLVYSQHRHDMVQVYGGSLDGGRSYTRVSGKPNLFTARVKDGIMSVIDNDEKLNEE